MEDREEKLSKAREKLDKFRKKKQKTEEPPSTAAVSVLSEDGKSKASSTNSPVMFLPPTQPPSDQVFQVSPEQQPFNYSQEPFLTPSTAVDSFGSSEAPPAVDQSNLASYFGSSGSETTQQFYIGGESQYQQLVSSTVSSEDSSQFSMISNSIDKIQETIKRDESINENLSILGLEQRCSGLEKDLEEERAGKAGLQLEITNLQEARARLESEVSRSRAEVENVQTTEVARLKTELEAQSKTIQLLVSEKSELQSLSEQLLSQKSSLEESKASLELSVEQLGSACSELRQEVVSSGTESASRERLERETEVLRETLQLREQSYSELQTKLAQLRREHDSLEGRHSEASSELEMSRLHLTQLRSGGAGGGQDLLREKDQEIEQITSELGVTRNNLLEALERISQLAGERDKLAEQYRGYSRDLASQAERLGEQLAKYQQENARLVTREVGLVEHVASLERELQVGARGGGGEELARIKERLQSSESEARLGREERARLQEMFEDRGVQVDEMTSRLGSKDNEIMELRASLSGLETTVDMLRTSSGCSGQAQAQLLAACESDKVAASRAMQQNLSLKQRLEELQGALVSLTNSKADLMDQLDTAQRKISTYSDFKAEISAREENSKEKDILISSLRQEVKHLRGNTQSSVTATDNQMFLLKERELEQAREIIRSLNSQNSELRSKLEVLSSNTRECSETRSNTSEAETSFSESSSESFEEVNAEKPSVPASPSSDSFVNVKDIGSIEDTIINTTDLPFVPHQTPSNSFQHLENRFIKAMEQIAKLSLDKEQLEHLVARLQDETETIGDYVVMYQHQRQQQKLKMQEKEVQLQQLAKDRTELSTKLCTLQSMVTTLMSASTKEDPTDQSKELTVSEKMKETVEKEKILELIADIGSDSAQMMATCEKFQPWFWEQSEHQVITV